MNIWFLLSVLLATVVHTRTSLWFRLACSIGVCVCLCITQQQPPKNCMGLVKRIQSLRFNASYRRMWITHTGHFLYNKNVDDN